MYMFILLSLSIFLTTCMFVYTTNYLQCMNVSVAAWLSWNFISIHIAKIMKFCVDLYTYFWSLWSLCDHPNICDKNIYCFGRYFQEYGGNMCHFHWHLLGQHTLLSERTPSDQGLFFQNGRLSPHIEEPVMKGHLSCRDTFSGILRGLLKTGFTVLPEKDSNKCSSFVWIVAKYEDFDNLPNCDPWACALCSLKTYISQTMLMINLKTVYFKTWWLRNWVLFCE